MPHIRALVSDDSYAGWQVFCAYHGITIAALCEAMGPTLAERTRDEELTEWGLDIVRRARAIADERRRR